MKQFTIPEGMRDSILGECNIKKGLQDKIEYCLDRWGYEEIITPTIEFYKTYEEGFDNINEQDMYKFFDAQGRILMLRADMTIPIARVVATKFKNADLPLRFRYTANVFKVHEELSGLKNEISDCGVELIGVEENCGDLEILSTAMDALKVVEDKNWVLEIGNINYFREACNHIHLAQKDCEELAKLINEKSLKALDDKLDALQLDDKYKLFFRNLPWLSGDVSILKEAENYVFCDELKKILANLVQLQKDLKELGYPNVQFDLGKTSNLNYYTGIIFEAFVEGVGTRVLSGGRYDSLIEKYGRALPAIGFSMKLDALLEVAQPLQKEKGYTVLYNHNSRIEAIIKGRKLRKQAKVKMQVDETIDGICVKEEV